MGSREPGSVSELLTRSRQGDEAAGQQLLLRLHKDFQGRIHANLRRLQSADKADIANDMLYRLYRGLIDGRYTQMQDRNDLWKLIGGINRNCRREVWKRRNTGKARAVETVPYPANHDMPDDGHGPDEIALFEESFQRVRERVEQHILAYPNDAFIREMLMMIVDGYLPREIKSALGISRSKYDSRYDLLYSMCKGYTNG
ncbi:MAG: ECF-type sigma factor [Planctomycetaceae bacterium]